MLPHWRSLIWQGLHSFIDPKAGTSMYYEHFFSCCCFFFCIHVFYRLSNGSLVICHCLQIFNLLSCFNMDANLTGYLVFTNLCRTTWTCSFMFSNLVSFEAPGPSDAQATSVYSALIQNMSMKFTKNQWIRRLYPFVDICMSRKSWPEACIRILSA